jgi:hypothetical protein
MNRHPRGEESSLLRLVEGVPPRPEVVVMATTILVTIREAVALTVTIEVLGENSTRGQSCIRFMMDVSLAFVILERLYNWKASRAE